VVRSSNICIRRLHLHTYRYDGTEQCLSSWQYAPMFSLIALAFLPLVMALRAMWLKQRFWAGGAAGPTSKGWFWEASYFEFYSSSFRDECPHWLPVQLYVTCLTIANFIFCDPSLCSFLRVLVLMMTIISFPYWRLFCINMILFIYLIVELIVRPWRMKSVQVFSFASFFLLVFATGILFRPASMELAAALSLHSRLIITFVFSSSDLHFCSSSSKFGH
jgi:hypothetical protein